MSRILRTVARLLFVLLSVFAVPQAFPAFLYQTPMVQEHILPSPREGSGDPVIVYWVHVVAASEVRKVDGPPERYLVEHEDAGIHPVFPIDVWVDLDGTLRRLDRAAEATTGSVEIREGYLRLNTLRNPRGRRLVIFKVVSGNLWGGDFNARSFFPT